MAVAKLDVKQFAEIVRGLSSSSDAVVKKSLFQLSSALVTNDGAKLLVEQKGVSALVNCIKLKGNAQREALKALKAFAAHDFAVEQLAHEEGLGDSLLEIGLQAAQSASAVSTVTQCLGLLTELIASKRGPAILDGEVKAAEPFRSRLTALVATCLAKREGEGEAPIDVRIASLKLLTAALLSSPGSSAYEQTLSSVTSNSELVASIKGMEGDYPALKDELRRYQALSAGFGKGEALIAILREENADLKKQLREIGSLASHFRESNVKLERDVNSYRRREPLVRMLWAEIAHLKGALNRAVEAGYSYDLGDPDTRYAPLDGIADIRSLDVWAFQHDTTSAKAKAKAKAKQERKRRASESDSDVEPDPPSDVEWHSDDEDGDPPAPPLDDTPPPSPKHAADAEAESSAPPPPPEVEAEAEAEAGAEGVPKPSGLDALAADPPPAPEPAPQPDPGAVPPAPPVFDVPAAPPFDAPPFDAPPMAPPFDAPMAPPMDGPPGAPPMAPAMSLGPQPTKPLVKPPKPMKALHWKRFIVDKDALEASIWAGAPDTEAGSGLVDKAEVFELFAAKPAKKLGGGGGGPKRELVAPAEEEVKSPVSSVGAGPGSPQAKDVRVLSDKRFNALSFMLSREKDLYGLVQAVRTLDDKVLTHARLEALRKNMPTQEEMVMVNETMASDEQLAKPELFVRLMSRIPEVAARLDCWAFKESFKDTAEEVLEPLLAIDSAIQATRNSTCLRRLLVLILELGNLINGGTARGQADGFDLQVLSRLAAVKDAQGTGNLLSFAAQLASKHFGHDFHKKLQTELSALAGAKEHSLRGAINDINKFLTDIETRKQETSLVVSVSQDAADPFKNVMTKFNAEAEEHASRMKSKRNLVKEAFADLLVYLNPSQQKAAAGKVHSGEFFTELLDFVESFVAAAEDIVRAKNAAAAPAKPPLILRSPSTPVGVGTGGGGKGQGPQPALPTPAILRKKG